MKPKYMVHSSQARCIDSPVEQERLLALDWVIASPKPRTKDARRMRTKREQMRAAGWASLTLWVSPEQRAAIKGALHPGESYAALLLRLIEQRSLL